MRLIQTWLSKTFRRAAWAPLAVIAVYSVAAKVFDAYIRWPNLDIPTHFFGGLAITFFFMVAVSLSEPLVGPLPRVVRSSLAIGFAAIAAILWEFLEFLSDSLFGTKMNLGVADTLSDLFFGLLGGVVVLLANARFKIEVIEESQVSSVAKGGGPEDR